MTVEIEAADTANSSHAKVVSLRSQEEALKRVIKILGEVNGA